MSDFRIGQRVMCIDDAFPRLPAKKTTVRPKRGEIYTVRGFQWHPALRIEGVVLQEIVNPVGRYPSGHYEPCWRPERFRPVRTTNIDVFLQMLAPAPREKQDA